MRLTIPPPSGCCTSCGGTGRAACVETNGLCWDCYGTGHLHPLGMFPWMRQIRSWYCTAQRVVSR